MYYYTGVLVGDRIVKQYVGGGEKGRLAAAADQAVRDSRTHAEQLRHANRRPVDELTVELDEFGELVDQLVTCQLLCTGWKKHNRGWRIAKHGRVTSHARES